MRSSISPASPTILPSISIPTSASSINFDCFRPLVQAAKDAGVKRFIYASSSRVYGIKNEPNVTEELALEPLTDYSKYKAMCEDVLEQEREPGFVAVTLRPATVCGYAPRLRLDLTVNILTNHAVNNGRITVFGGDQLRPNIHVEDMTDLYLRLLEAPDEADRRQGLERRLRQSQGARDRRMVREEVGPKVDIVVTPTDDHRSYHVSSEKIRRELGFVPDAHGRRRDRRSRHGLHRRQGAERDDRRPLLQHQAHAGPEAAMSDNGRVRREPPASPRSRRVSRSGCAWAAPKAVQVSAAGMGPSLHQAVPRILSAHAAGSRQHAGGRQRNCPAEFVFLTSSEDCR